MHAVPSRHADPGDACRERHRDPAAAIDDRQGSIIIAEIAYNYASPTTKVITGPINFTNNFYAKPRRVAQLAAPACGCP